MNVQTIPANVQDPAEMEAESGGEAQQPSTRIPDPSQAVEEAAREG